MKKIVVREEFIKLADDFIGGVILQYIFEISENISEEYAKTNLHFDEYFKLDFAKISEENLLGISVSSIRRYVAKFIKKGYLDIDKSSITHRYRVNRDMIISRISNENNDCTNKNNNSNEIEGYVQESLLCEQKKNSLPSPRNCSHNKYNDINYNINIIKSQDESNENLFEKIKIIIIDIMNNTENYIRINKENKPINLVKEVFSKIDSDTVNRVIEKFKLQTNRIINIKSYIVTMLYNTVIEEGFSYINEDNFNLEQKHNNIFKANKNSFLNFEQPNYEFEKLDRMSMELLKMGI